MTARLSLFTGTLVQDSALSVSGIDRESSSDQPFAMVDGVPVLAGRGLKGAAVAMARRFFDPLPRSISEDASRRTALRRSAWEFSNATLAQNDGIAPQLRAGVGILQKTGARATGVLYDREVVPAGTRWPLVFRVDWSLAGDEANEVEGILGYVLAEHWARERCWLGGGVARGLGWCHVEDLRAWRLDGAAYERWVESGRTTLPAPLAQVPSAQPTRSWCLRTLDVNIGFGEYQPDGPDEPAWGMDMLAVGPHDADRAEQDAGSGTWSRPSWVNLGEATPDSVSTDRAILMEGGRPLLPGASVRGPMRHALSRGARARGQTVQDPHPVEGKVEEGDEAGDVFGTVTRSSRVLIRDGRADEGWAAARLHMHAEDEFTAGSYESAKRDAVRLLRGEFPVRVIVEGPDDVTVAPLVAQIDHLVALGALGHLPVGGHKTRGAGWGHWKTQGWRNDDVEGTRTWVPRSTDARHDAQPSPPRRRDLSAWSEWRERLPETSWVRLSGGDIDASDLTLGQAATLARAAMKGESTLIAWWCEPMIDFSVVRAPATFGHHWPDDDPLKVDEVVFFLSGACWRAARTAAGPRWVLVKEVEGPGEGDRHVTIIHTPARLYGDTTRFSSVATSKERVLLREWHADDGVLGFTLVKGGQ